MSQEEYINNNVIIVMEIFVLLDGGTCCYIRCCKKCKFWLLCERV